MKRCRKLVMGLSLVLAMTFLIGTTSFAGVVLEQSIA